MTYNYSHKQAGFSLVETLVAITILLIVITGPLTLVSNSARSTNFANDQVMANFLAQEGLELAQAARDDLLIPTFASAGAPNAAWNAFTDTGSSGRYRSCFTTAGCGFDQNTNSSGTIVVYSCQTGGGTGCRLYPNTDPEARSQYTHVVPPSTVPSRYTRRVTMTQSLTGQVEVVSRVTWRSDGQRAEQSVEAVTYLFNVYGR